MTTALEQDYLQTEIKNGIGFITLNRPSALNTLNISMVRAMYGALIEWSNNNLVKAVVVRGKGEKAFCAGGDVRRVHECIVKGLSEYDDFFKEEFALNEYIYNYPKPYIALMNGIVMGGGMGITQGASFRIVNETTRIAMPETAIGYFPDVGASYFLTRHDPAIANYLGLTGKNLNHYDALFCKLADWSLPSERWVDFLNALEDLGNLASAETELKNEITKILQSLNGSRDYVDSEVYENLDLIKTVFSSDSLHAIFSELNHLSDNTWSNETKASMLRNSPLAMAATLQLLSQGRKLGLSECFKIELELTQHWRTKGEFVEGVRAALIDKDKNPKWKYSIDNVDQAFLKQHFPALFKYH